jgi:hypothetical protein
MYAFPPREPEETNLKGFWSYLYDNTICYFRGYALILVCVVGVCGNLINLLVLTQKRLRAFSVNILLTGLAVLDILFLVSHTWAKQDPECFESHAWPEYSYRTTFDAYLRLAAENLRRIGIDNICICTAYMYMYVGCSEDMYHKNYRSHTNDHSFLNISTWIRTDRVNFLRACVNTGAVHGSLQIP